MPTSSFVESGFWCFDALFVPQQHPARDLQDTFYLSGECEYLDFTGRPLIQIQILRKPYLPTLSTTSVYQLCTNMVVLDQQDTGHHGLMKNLANSSSARTPLPPPRICSINSLRSAEVRILKTTAKSSLMEQRQHLDHRRVMPMMTVSDLPSYSVSTESSETRLWMLPILQSSIRSKELLQIVT